MFSLRKYLFELKFYMDIDNCIIYLPNHIFAFVLCATLFGNVVAPEMFLAMLAIGLVRVAL